MKPNLKTFCPLPWMHIMAKPNGAGELCCKSGRFLKDSKGQRIFWKNVRSLHSYFNSEDYKKVRLQMLNGERPDSCSPCFHQEDYGVRSKRQQALYRYGSSKKIINSLVESTNPDGSIDQPHILYLDMALSNKCNLRCRMCTPWNSHLIGQDWEKMKKTFDGKSIRKIAQDKWYSSSNCVHLIHETLPSLQVMHITGGEPLLLKEHLQMLEMIVEKGHADHILLRYNTNQTIIPDKVVSLWKFFKEVEINCSIEAFGKLNDYIRYPSKWSKLEKNMYYLDELSFQNPHIRIYIHTTVQVYNVLGIPKFLNWLRKADFKALYRFPYFIWVRTPEWLCPGVYPKNFRNKIIDKILESLDLHEDFFLNYNKGAHYDYSRDKMKILRGFSEMIRQDSSQEKHFETFIKETKAHDVLRNQSVTRVLPELKPFFPEY